MIYVHSSGLPYPPPALSDASRKEVMMILAEEGNYFARRGRGWGLEREGMALRSGPEYLTIVSLSLSPS